MQDSYSNFRLFFFVILIGSLFGVAISWVFLVASKIELDLFFSRIMLSFAYIFLGFGFYQTGFPERVTSNY